MMQTASSAPLQNLELYTGYVVLVIVAAFGFLLIWKIADGSIDLAHLLSDDDGWASTSRFQLVIFTFVVALSFFLVVVSNVKVRQFVDASKTTTSENEEEKSPLPDVPGGVLALLGISASSYLVSRGISASTDSDGGESDGGGAAPTDPTSPAKPAAPSKGTTATPAAQA